MSHATAPVPKDIAGMPLGRSALWWLIASEIVIFGGLVACFLMFKWRHPEWAEMASQTSATMGATT